MTEPADHALGRPAHAGSLDHEHASWLALLPILATFGFYLLPHAFRQTTVVQFVPQLIAYAALISWAQLNRQPVEGFGLEFNKIREGLHLGTVVGIVLGLLNVSVILWLVPKLGRDITFLRETPHARIPVWIMLPWFIAGIAVFVELNFRGFQLGRLVRLAQRLGATQAPRVGHLLALLVSATTFAFDPFLVSTFQHLHWIALWDGLVWGVLWIRRRNLYLTIVAHAVEVVMLYSVVRTWLEG